MLAFLFRYATHLKDFYNESNLTVKQRLIGSNFVHNLQIDSEKVQTAFWSPAMGFINQIYSELQIGIKEKGQQFADLFELAPQDEEISNRFRDDLLIFNELIKLYELQL